MFADLCRLRLELLHELFAHLRAKGRVHVRIAERGHQPLHELAMGPSCGDAGASDLAIRREVRRAQPARKPRDTDVRDNFVNPLIVEVRQQSAFTVDGRMHRCRF